ncbi:MAG: hypothetical protein HZA35_02980 [Parcubacteria group bacterium]|nr:hypothetical protein [Parcubacteria group bacterium]
MVFLKRLGYIFFLGIATFVLIGASVGFMTFALRTPLMLLELVSPIKNGMFLVFLALVVLFLAGMGMDLAFRHGFSFGNKSMLNQTPALTSDGSVVFVMGEEVASDGRVYVKVLMPIAHPIPGFLKIIPREKIMLLNNPPTEMIKVIMSNGVIQLGGLEIKEVEKKEE